MKRFRFRLEKILQLRIREEEEALSGFRAAMAKVRAVEREMERIEAARRETEEALFAERKKTNLDVSLNLIFQAGLERLAGELLRARERLAQEQQAADQEREFYRFAKLKREQLERVKDRHRRRHEASGRAEEMKGLDEAAKVRFLQNSAGEGPGHERSGRS